MFGSGGGKQQAGHRKEVGAMPPQEDRQCPESLARDAPQLEINAKMPAGDPQFRVVALLWLAQWNRKKQETPRYEG